MDDNNERSNHNSHSFNLNLHPSAQSTTDTSDHQLKEGGELMEVISRMYRENRKMTEMVADMFDKYLALHSHLTHFITSSSSGSGGRASTDLHRKRKAAAAAGSVEEEHDDNHKTLPPELGSCCSRRQSMISCCKPKISTVFTRVDHSDNTLVVKDGYQWRKYGQKNTRDNPSPRAYYKCSYAPLCGVKKKVQKSVEDPTILVATYEGEHNHKQPSKLPTLNPSNIIATTTSSSTNLGPISPPTPLDHLIRQNLSESSHKDSGSERERDDSEAEQLRIQLQSWLVDRLAKDPSFTSSLAAAISDKVLEQTF